MSTEYTIDFVAPGMRRLTRTKIDRVIVDYEHACEPDILADSIQIDQSVFAVLGHGIVYGGQLVLPHDGYLSDDELLRLARADALPVGWDPDAGSIEYRPA